MFIITFSLLFFTGLLIIISNFILFNRYAKQNSPISFLFFYLVFPIVIIIVLGNSMVYADYPEEYYVLDKQIETGQFNNEYYRSMDNNCLLDKMLEIAQHYSRFEVGKSDTTKERFLTFVTEKYLENGECGRVERVLEYIDKAGLREKMLDLYIKAGYLEYAPQILEREKVDDKTISLMTLIAQKYHENGEIEKSHEIMSMVLEKAEKINYHKEAAYYCISMTFYNIGNYEEMFRYMDKGHSATRIFIGSSCYADGRYDLAKKVLNKEYLCFNNLPDNNYLREELDRYTDDYLARGEYYPEELLKIAQRYLYLGHEDSAVKIINMLLDKRTNVTGDWIGSISNIFKYLNQALDLLITMEQTETALKFLEREISIVKNGDSYQGTGRLFEIARYCKMLGKFDLGERLEDAAVSNCKSKNLKNTYDLFDDLFAVGEDRLATQIVEDRLEEVDGNYERNRVLIDVFQAGMIDVGDRHISALLSQAESVDLIGRYNLLKQIVDIYFKSGLYDKASKIAALEERGYLTGYLESLIAEDSFDKALDEGDYHQALLQINKMNTIITRLNSMRALYEYLEKHNIQMDELAQGIVQKIEYLIKDPVEYFAWTQLLYDETYEAEVTVRETDFNNDGLIDFALTSKAAWGRAGGTWQIFLQKKPGLYYPFVNMFFNPMKLQALEKGKARFLIYHRSSGYHGSLISYIITSDQIKYEDSAEVSFVEGDFIPGNMYDDSNENKEKAEKYIEIFESSEEIPINSYIITTNALLEKKFP